jgi:hypothetical protein
LASFSKKRCDPENNQGRHLLDTLIERVKARKVPPYLGAIETVSADERKTGQFHPVSMTVVSE